MRTGLVGHTGFVGGTLTRSGVFDALYNSGNVEAMRGERFGLMVCAGVSAVKWQANREPAADWAGIRRLMDALDGADIEELLLVSTIDVYPVPGAGGDEGTAIDAGANHAYGRHRYELERWCLERFPVVRVVRLPALFGPGLRKNAVYDLMHGNMVESINPAGVFQWYPVTRLWTDIGVVRREGLTVVNLFPEPLAMRAIMDGIFPGVAIGPAVEAGPRYDMQTRHGRLFGGDEHYVMGAEASLAALADYVRGERR